MKYVLIHVVSSEEINFYNRFECTLNDLSLDVLYTTTSLYCYLLLIASRKRAKLIFNNLKPDQLNSELNKEFFNSLVGWSNKEEALVSYFSSYNTGMKLFRDSEFFACFIPSGRLASQEGIFKACKDNNVPTIFSGYGNFPGKTFFDRSGTDKNASLFKDRSLLSELTYDHDSFKDWKESYIISKIKSHSVPQVRAVNFKMYLSRASRILFCKIEKLLNVALDINRDTRSLFEFKKFNYNEIATSLEKLPDNYVFMPLQYTKDAQLILNYDKDLIASIEDALTICRQSNISLVIKPHPVENSIEAYNEIKSIVQNNDDLLLSNGNTFRLIERSSRVVTVNSTAGLESMLMGKNVLFLGDSFYKGMTEEEIGCYLSSFLVDIDYFDVTPIDKNTLLKIFSICKVN